MKQVILLVGLLACGNVLANDGYTCPQHMYNYGLATNAQVNCGFKHWNDSVTDYAKQCYSEAEQDGTTDELESAIKDGIKSFQQQYSQAQNKTDICNAFQKDFSDFVR